MGPDMAEAGSFARSTEALVNRRIRDDPVPSGTEGPDPRPDQPEHYPAPAARSGLPADGGRHRWAVRVRAAGRRRRG
jgi:hypothetical protein